MSFLAIFAATLAMSPLPALGGARRPGFGAIREGFAYLRGRQVLQGVYLLDLNAMILGMPSALFPAFATQRFHGGSLVARPPLRRARGRRAPRRLHDGLGRERPPSRPRRRDRGDRLGARDRGLRRSRACSGSPSCSSRSRAGRTSSAPCSATRSSSTSIGEEFRTRLSSIQMAVVTGGPRLGNFEAGAVAAVTSPAISAVTGGLACAIGALLLAWRLPAFTKEGAPLR